VSRYDTLKMSGHTRAKKKKKTCDCFFVGLRLGRLDEGIDLFELVLGVVLLELVRLG
jgi:hypothetical protein